jgi:hypothetical protein
MAYLFYEVHLSRNEEMARDHRYLDTFLVQLVCDKHSDQRWFKRHTKRDIHTAPENRRL